MYEIKKRVIPKQGDCTDCNNKGGSWDCGWWYECPQCHPEAYSSKTKEETNEQ